MMKKRLAALLLLLSVLFVIPFAGCGETPEAEKQPPEQTEPGENDPDPKPAPPEQTDPDPTEPELIEGLQVVCEKEMKTFSEEDMFLFGRTYMKGKELCLDNGGTGIEVTFFGTKFEADIMPYSASSRLYCRYYIDGDTEGTFRALTGNRVYTLAKDLEEGVHTVRIVKSTSSQNGVIRIGRLLTDGKFLRPKKEKKLRVEFVGDSITVGAGIFATTSEACTISNSDTTLCYAYLTAQALDADFSFVATEGICVKAKSALNVNMLEMYRSYSSVNLGEYPYPAQSHDLVVLALGTNDGYYMGAHADYTVEIFTEDYIELLTLIREKNPEAKIVCVYGMMGASSGVETGIQAAIEKIGDTRISYCRLPADAHGGGGHPSQDGAKAQSRVLLEFLETVI